MRSLSSGKTVKATTEAETGSHRVVEARHLDLSSYDSIKFSDRVSEDVGKIDALIENAAAARHI